MKDKRIKLTIEIDGLNKVSLEMDLGWMYSIRMCVEGDHVEDATTKAINILENVEVGGCEDQRWSQEDEVAALDCVDDMIKKIRNADYDVERLKLSAENDVLKINVEFEGTSPIPRTLRILRSL